MSALKGHPKGLYLIFATSTAERFSYYGMRAIFILFLTQALLFDKEAAASIYMLYFDVIAAEFWPIVIATIVSTALVLVVTGWVHQIVRKIRLARQIKLARSLHLTDKINLTRKFNELFRK